MKKVIFLSLLAIGSSIALTVTAPWQTNETPEYRLYEQIENTLSLPEAPTRVKQAEERTIQFVGGEYETRVFVEINQERAKAGLPSLTGNSKLSAAASLKLEDMLQKGYFVHRNPEGQDHNFFIDQVGYPRKYAGENLARYYPVPEEAVKGFMASPAHKANILHSGYTDIGIAYAEKDNLLVVVFGSK